LSEGRTLSCGEDGNRGHHRRDGKDAELSGGADTMTASRQPHESS
jgi:hypothetical protein